MERLRWTPLLQGRRMIVVNVPEFMLRAYTVEDGRVDVQLEMKIIVGKALDTRTPLFDEDMRYIEFSPYWNVPRSIALQETLPKLREEPGYFAQQGFEFVTPDRRVVEVLSDAAIEAVQQGHNLPVGVEHPAGVVTRRLEDGRVGSARQHHLHLRGD